MKKILYLHIIENFFFFFELCRNTHTHTCAVFPTVWPGGRQIANKWHTHPHINDKQNKLVYVIKERLSPTMGPRGGGGFELTTVCREREIESNTERGKESKRWAKRMCEWELTRMQRSVAVLVTHKQYLACYVFILQFCFVHQHKHTSTIHSNAKRSAFFFFTFQNT